MKKCLAKKRIQDATDIVITARAILGQCEITKTTTLPRYDASAPRSARARPCGRIIISLHPKLTSQSYTSVVVALYVMFRSNLYSPAPDERQRLV